MRICFTLIFIVLWFTDPLCAQTAGGKQRPFNRIDNILLLFYRIYEPLFIPKWNISFQLPTEYLPPRYQSIASDITEKYYSAEGTENIAVKAVKIPDLSIPLKLGRQQIFSHFIPSHRDMACKLIDIFMKAETFEDFLSTAIYCRDRVNPHMFVFALAIAILHRADTKNLQLPSLANIFPDSFIEGSVFQKAKTEVNSASPGTKVLIEIPKDYTASDLEPEHRIAYYREDIGFNSNHWHWHLVYPADGDLKIVNKDRRGELFYYFHQQILARYNAERLSNGLRRVESLAHYDEPIREGYFSKLNYLIASRVWPPRTAFATLKDVHRDGIHVRVVDLVRWEERILAAIQLGRAVNEKGEAVDLTETNGMDVLANIVEPSILSVNQAYYGSLHNSGHTIISLCHDPDGRYLENPAVMASLSTAVRDPIFFRWHSLLNDIFLEHKNTLPSYTESQISFPGVNVTQFGVIAANTSRNEFLTFWRKRRLDISKGLDFEPAIPVNVLFTVLDHSPFMYIFQVENSGPPRLGMARIFLAPTYDEDGSAFEFMVQRTQFLELDKFPIQLKTGFNSYQRSSKDSSVTIPAEASYRDLHGQETVTETTPDVYCSCGFPDNLLIPKGNLQGLHAKLFIMISNYAEDKVDQAPAVGCKQAHSICGLNDRLYPDKRPMGYPFDRIPRDGVTTLDQFITSNMAVIDVKIRHIDKVVNPGIPSSL